ncbi:hypothetical protein L1987_44089 [Smallanthus sonchifolius]|uniref:Uncharacterized protein n=1 Tax=Smallanthus sonchifolius TaxID=185202 RepID=A0ACB9GPH1_9ASTR|nr:hypothetical protein L1987_44089 [Smallanthus sonchifolius]
MGWGQEIVLNCALKIHGAKQSNGDCYFQSPSPVMENTVTQQKQFSEGQVLLQSCEDHYDLLDAVVSCSKSKKKPRASKKDGHGLVAGQGEGTMVAKCCERSPLPSSYLLLDQSNDKLRCGETIVSGNSQGPLVNQILE